jgi:hypothetical protein
MNAYKALVGLFPPQPNETPVAWASRAKNEGIITEQEWKDLCQFIRAHLYAFAKWGK